MEELNLGMSEFAVSRALVELESEKNYVSAALIAEHIGCEQTAVYRAMKRLKRAGRLERIAGNPRWGGYRYRVIK